MSSQEIITEAKGLLEIVLQDIEMSNYELGSPYYRDIIKIIHGLKQLENEL